MAHYAKVLQDRGYIYGDIVLPHDAKQRELQSGKSRVEALNALGLKPVVQKAHRVEDGIEAVRAMLAKMWFDEKNCSRGIEALRQYRKEPAPEHMWRDKSEPEYRDRPIHDWASHGADAFRIGAMHKPVSNDWGELKYERQGIV